jgi:SAM-dependent methyltransferase
MSGIEDFYDWDKHWSVYDANTQINPAQQFRFQIISNIVGKLSVSVLVDIGCGQGDLLRFLSDEHKKIRFYGFELSASGVSATRSKVPSAIVEELDLFRDDATRLLTDVNADVATCSEVLEHVPNPGEFLCRAMAAVKPGGYFIATVPGGPRSNFDIQIGHLRHFTKDSARQLFEGAGYEVPSVYGAGFPFFNLYKLAAMIRGNRVANDYKGQPTLVFKTTMRLFGFLFKLSRTKSSLGWQIVVVAKVPTSQAASIEQSWKATF